MSKEKINNIFQIIILIFLAIYLMNNINFLINMQQKQEKLEKRIKQLEIDYKIYELNLEQLKENKDVQFE